MRDAFEFARDQLLASFDELEGQLQRTRSGGYLGIEDRTARRAAGDLVEETLETVKRLRSFADTLLTTRPVGSIAVGSMASEGIALALINTIQTVNTEIETLPVRIEARTHIRKAGIGDWLKQHIEPLLKRLSTWLWQIVSTMLTPRSWKLTGEFGASAGPFGLAKSSFEIDFGT